MFPHPDGKIWIFVSPKSGKCGKLPPIVERSIPELHLFALNEVLVFPPFRAAKTRTSSKWRAALFVLFIGGLAVGIGADRQPADATRVRDWQGETEYKLLPSNTFRVASFNIHGGKGMDRKLDLKRISQVIAGVKPHFVGLNEVHGTRFGTQPNQAQELGQHLNWSSLFVPTERRFWQSSFGNGLLSQVETTSVHVLPLPCTQGKKYRNATLTSFQVGEQTVRVICVHLDRVQDREKQLNRVFSLFCDLEQPAILMGDLNTFPDDPLLAHWRETHPEIQDAVGEFLKDKDPPRRIDWIFTRGLTTTNAGCVANKASDHPLVWAEFQMPARLESDSPLQQSNASN